MALSGSPIPGGDIYGWRKLDAEKAYQNSLVALGRRRQGVLQQYGYTADFDPETGEARNTRIDPFSQYGAVQQMLRGQAQQYDALDDSLRERGISGPGLGAQAQGELRHIAGGQAAQLGQGLLGDLSDLAGSQLQAKQARDAAQWEAEWEAARAAIEDQAFTPADTAGIEDANLDAPLPTDPPAVQEAKVNKARAAAAARALRLRSEALNQKYGLGKTPIINHRAMETAASKKPLPKPAPKKAPPKPKKKGK